MGLAMVGLDGVFILTEELIGAQEATIVDIAMVTIVGTGMDIIEDIPEVPGQVMQQGQETQMFIKTVQPV